MSTAAERKEKTNRQNELIIKAQPGTQEKLLSCSADVIIFGGAAGGGKTFSVLMKPFYYVFNDKDYRAMVFRRVRKDITTVGSAFDISRSLYSNFATENKTDLKWTFKSGAVVSFGGMEHLGDEGRYSGSQIDTIIFEELQEFLEKQFTFMFSRNRGKSKAKKQIICTCNPRPESWILKYIEWYLDDDGYPLHERSGIIRYFFRQNDDIFWGNSRQELIDKFGNSISDAIKSFTFISSLIYDNKILLETNPEYIAGLKNMSFADREMLLNGCWKVSLSQGTLFKTEWFEIIDAVPTNLKKVVRFWDKAGTVPTNDNPDPDYSVGLKMGIDENKTLYILDVVRDRVSPETLLNIMRNTATQDGVSVAIGIEKEGGSSGQMDERTHIKNLLGFNARFYKPLGVKGHKGERKIIDAKPVSAQAERGNIKVLRAKWNTAFFNELVNFPSKDYHDDQVDALSGAFGMLVGLKNTAVAKQAII